MRAILSSTRATDLPAISDGVPPPKKIVSTIGRVVALRLRRPVQFAFDRLDPARFIDRGADMAVEIAIGTFGGAEGPMDINAEATADAASWPTRHADLRQDAAVQQLLESAGAVAHGVFHMRIDLAECLVACHRQ